MERLHISGVGDPEKRRRLEEKARERQKKGLERYEGEKDKTPEQLRIIEAVNFTLTKAATDEGWENIEPIDAERVHFLDYEQWRKAFGGLSGGQMGEMRAEERGILVNEDEALAEEIKFATLLHESIHYLAASKTMPDDNPEQPYRAYRIGYKVTKRSGERRAVGPLEDDLQFMYFDEAVVTMTVYLLADKYRDELNERFGLKIPEYDFEPSEKDKEQEYAYFHRKLGYMLAVEHFLIPIIEEVAAYKGEEVDETAWRIMRHQFTGNMMHLRDIVRAMGKNALRVIALCGKWRGEQGKEMNAAIVGYVKTKNPIERERLAEEILKKYGS